MHDRSSTCALPQDLLKFFKLLIIQESYFDSIQLFILLLAWVIALSVSAQIGLIENNAFIIICLQECALCTVM